MRVSGAPVAVGMSIDVASIDMVSEVNMVSAVLLFHLIDYFTYPFITLCIWSCHYSNLQRVFKEYKPPLQLFPCPLTDLVILLKDDGWGS